MQGYGLIFSVSKLPNGAGVKSRCSVLGVSVIVLRGDGVVVVVALGATGPTNSVGSNSYVVAGVVVCNADKLSTGEVDAREADANRFAFDKGATGPTFDRLIGSMPKFVDVRGPRLIKSVLNLNAITQPSG
jgi:hypothetical protein